MDINIIINQCFGAGTFWSEPDPVKRSGSGSTLDKTEEILSDTGILSVRSNIE